MRVWKTTLRILTFYDPDKKDLLTSDLCHAVLEGEALCFSTETEEVSARAYKKQITDFIEEG